jgi:hypothetical protein
MAGHAAGHGRPDHSGRDAYAPGYYVSGTADGGIDPPARAIPADAVRQQTRSSTTAKGFLGSLFDFSFTSFVTPKIIKVLYVLITIGTVITALFYSYLDYRVNAAFGILTLFVIAPLVSLIVLASWRIFLEFFMIIFRISDDIRHVREQGEIR